jgi:cytochrome P450
MQFTMTPAQILALARAPEPGDPDPDYDPFEAFDRAQGATAVADPYPVFGELLAECPVHAGAQSHRFGAGPSMAEMVAGEQPVYNVYSFEAVETVLKDGRTFSSTGYAKSMGLVMGHTILEMDEPEHGRYRRLIQQAFTRKEMDRWEAEIVGPIVHHYIDAFADRGRADLVGEFTFVYPVHVISVALGLPEADLPTFYRKAVEVTNMGAEPMRGFAASQWLYDYLLPHVQERRENPREDLISILATAEITDPDGTTQQLTDDEIIAFLRLLLPAGAETTYRSTSNLLVGLLTNPEQLAAVVADRSLLPQAIEEAVRWEPPLTGISRTASVDAEVCGVPVPAGASIAVCMGAANHDPSRWQDPDRFDIFREQRTHTSFANGPHLCLGIHLARMEMRVALEALFDRLPGLRLDPGAEPPAIVGMAFRAPHHLHVTWD